MEVIRCVYGHWRENGHFTVAYPNMVHLHFLPYHGLTPDRLFHTRVLVEYEALYFVGASKPAMVRIELKSSRKHARQVFKAVSGDRADINGPLQGYQLL